MFSRDPGTIRVQYVTHTARRKLYYPYTNVDGVPNAEMGALAHNNQHVSRALDDGNPRSSSSVLQCRRSESHKHTLLKLTEFVFTLAQAVRR
jgi:hypothetical protein